MKKKLICRVLSAALVLSSHAMVDAAVLTWDGSDTTTSGAQGGSGTWDTNTTANWWDGSADVVWPALGGTSDDAVFENTAGTVTLGAGGVTAHNLTFNTTGYLLTGSTLTLNGTTPTISTNTGVTSTINSIIAGTAGLTKTGAGTLVLGGVNTYTGGTTVSVGTIQAVVNTTQSGISSGAVSVASGATLQLDNTTILGTGLTIANTFTGAGTLKLNFAANTTPRNTTLNNVTGFTGTIRLANAGATGDKWTVGGLTASGASVVVEDGSQLFVSTGTSTFAGINVTGNGNSETRGAIRLGGTLVGTVTLAGNTSIGTEGGTISGNITSGAAGAQTLTLGTTSSIGNATLSGIIGGGTGTIALNKTAAGTVTLTGVNTYTGGTTVNAGTLQIGNGTINGTVNGTFSIATGATLRLQYNSSGATAPNWANISGAGTLTLATAKTFDSGWGTPALPAGFTGTVRIEGGRVIASGAAGQGFGGATAIVITAGGHLGAWAGGTITQNLTIAGTGYGETGYESAIRLGNTGTTTTLSGTVALSANATLAASGGAGILTGVVSGAAGSTLTFGTASQAGTVTLSGANTYAGPTVVNWGTLKAGVASVAGVSGAFGINSAVSLANTAGATVDLNGFNTQIGSLAGGGATGGNVALGAATLTLGADNTNTGYSGVISGTGGIIKIGTGAQSFVGANTFSGGLTINAGTAAISAAAGTGTAGGNVAGFGTGTVTVNSTGTAWIHGSGASFGTIANPWVLGGGTLHIEDGATTFSGTVNVTGTSVVQERWGDLITFSNVVSGTGALTFQRSASGTSEFPTFLLSGANTTTGTITAGANATVRVGNVAALGNVSAGTSVTSGGVLDLNGFAVGAEPITLNGTGISSGGALINSSATAASLSGTISLASASSVGGTGTGALTLSGIISGANSLTKVGTGTTILTAVNTYSGGTTVTGGELQALVPTTAGAYTTFGSGTITANAGATLRFKTGSTGNAQSYANNLAINGATFVSEDGVVTYGGTVALTGANTFNVVYANKNALFTNVLSGTGSLNKTSAGDMILSAANTYTGAVTISGGAISLTGANGALGSPSGFTLANGGTLKLDNTSGANNLNRVGDTVPISMTGGTLNFSNNAGAVNYSETIGALTLSTGASTITASQAAVGQTSALTMPSLTRTSGGTVNFTGTGLGVDNRNRILITANPTLSGGLIGFWATYNGSSLATYNATLGVQEAAHTDLTRLSSGSKVIVDGPTNNVSLIEGTGAAGNITLGSPVTTINTLFHTASGGASAALVDTANQTLRLGAAGGILSQATAGALTIGTTLAPGILTAGGADNTAGVLTLFNNSTNGITINSAITNNGSGVVGLTVDGPGAVTLAGNTSNTFTGMTTLAGGTSQFILAKTGGAYAIGGDINMSSAAVRSILSTTLNNQFAPGSVMRFTASGVDTRFELKGTTQTLGGIDSTGFTGPTALIQHSEFGAPVATGGLSTLILDVSGANTYNFGTASGSAGLRNQGGILALTKQGSGTQILTGPAITYTGATFVNGGTLELVNTNAFASTTTVAGGSTLVLSNTGNIGIGGSGIFTLNSGATLVHNGQNNGADYLTLAGAVTVSGATTINQNSIANTTGANKNLFLDGGLKGSGTLTINAANAGNGVIFRNNNSTFTGTIIVNGIASTTVNLGSGIGVGGATTALRTADITLNGTMELLNQGVGWAATASGTFAMGALNGSGVMIGNFTSGGVTTVTLGSTNNNGAFSGIIANGTGNTVHLVKTGTATQTLSGTNTYTGLTTVSNGKLLLDFAAGGTSNIIAPTSGLTLGGGTLEIKGGAGETNTQTFAGVTSTAPSTLQLTLNGATSLNATLGAITNTGISGINFVGGNTTVLAGVATAGTANFITTTVAGSNNAATRLGANLWNGTDWASTASNGSGTTYVVGLQGYTDIYNGTTPGPVAIPTGSPNAEIRILEATSGFTNNTLGASATINSLLMNAATTAATVDMGTFTLTVGNGAGATGAIGITSTGKSLTLGTTANQGVVTAGTTSAASILALNNANALSSLTVNSVIANNAAAGVVSLNTMGNVLLNGTNTFTGATTILGGTLEVGGAGSLGSGNYAGAIANNGTLLYSSSANQTISGIISGLGGLTKTGASTLTLGANETFTGTTTISAGSLVVGSGGAAGSLAGPIVNNANLTFFRNDAAQVNPAGVISGTGNVTYNGPVVAVSGQGQYLVDDTNTYTGTTTVSNARINLTNIAGIGTGPVVISNGGQIFVSVGGTFSNAITINGNGWTEAAGALGAIRLNNNPILTGPITMASNSRISSYGSSGTINGVISGAFDLDITGAAGGNIITFGGTASNTYSGTTTISSGSLALAKTGGAYAIAGPVTMLNEEARYLYATQNNQFAGGSVLTMSGGTGHGRFELLGTTQTLAGVANDGTGRGVIQQREQVGAGSVSTLSRLILDGTGTYSFNGYLRDTGGLIAVTKTGSGTQTFSGVNISYSGGTTVSGGVLKLIDTSGFNGAITNTATVEFNAPTGGRAVGALAGSGTFNKTGAGIFQLNGGQTITTSGQFNIQAGTLQNNNNAVNWAGSTADIDVSSGAILDLFADAIYVDQLTGSGFVQNNFGNATGQSGSSAFLEKLVLGVANGNATFSGVIRNNATNVALAAGVGNGGLELTKVGTGTQTLSGTNLYTGPTTINNGTLLLDFAAGGTSNILSASTAVTLGGGSLEIKGGSGEADTQTVNGVSGFGKLLLTPNGATSLNMTLGTIGAGAINFVGSDATVGALGTANFLTTTTTTGSDGSTKLGAHLWNGSDWASTSSTGGNHVVKWVGPYTDLTTDGNTSNPAGDLRILDGAALGTAGTYTASTTINSILMTAPTYGSTLNLGSTTLTVGNGAAATGYLAIGTSAQSLTIGATANQGTLTAGTSGASTLQFNNANPASTLTVNSVIANNAGAGVVSLNTTGKIVLAGTNTYTGGTTINLGSTLEIGGSGRLGSGAYAGAISNAGVLRYNSSANQTLSGTFNGAGSLVKDTAGSTLTLNGAGISYSGGTTINAGSVDWQNISSVASGTMTINAGGTLTTSLIGVNSNINSFLVLNGGSITSSVVGNANYGNFTINSTAGVTVGGTQQSLISADVRLGNNATTNFDVGATGDVSGIDLEVTGKFSHYESVTWGYMTKSGLGVMRFNNPNPTNNIGSITVNAGKVILANYINNGGNGGLTANAAGTIDFNPGTNQTFGNALHGSGVFNKEGLNTLTLTANSDATGTFNINSGKVIAAGGASTGLGNVIVKAGTTLQSNGGDFLGYASNTSQITIQGGTVTTGTGGAYRNTISKLVFDGGGLLTSGAGNVGDANGHYSLYNNGATTTTVSVINPGATTARISAPIFTLWGTLTGGTSFDVARGTAGSDFTISGSLRTQGTGSTPIIKTGAGIMTLSGQNTFVGNITVSQGTLIGTTTTSLGAITNSLTVAPGASFAYQAAIPGSLNLGLGGLTFGSGSRIGASLGGTLGQSALASSSAAVASGAITVDVYGISGGTTATGTHNLITAASGLTSSGATYTLGNVYNPTNFTVNPASFNQSNTAISLGVTSATPLATAYWKGGFSGATNVWAISNGSTASNWSSTAGGTDTPLVPGSGTIVNFSATGATNQGAMTLGANMNIGGIVVNDTNPVTLNAGSGSLTINAGGILINSGAGAVGLNTDLTLGNHQQWTNNSSNLLTVGGNVSNNGANLTVNGTGNTAISGIISGTGNLNKTGNGILTLSGANVYSGDTTVNAGILRAGALAGGRAFGESSAVTLANVAGATLDLNNFNQSIGSLSGGGALGGNVSLGSGVLTMGVLNTSTTYSGVISGNGGWTKTGTGVMTLDGTVSNTASGTTIVDNGTLILAKTGGAVAIGGNIMLGNGNGNQPNLRMTASNQFAPGSVMTFPNLQNNWGRFELLDTNQTLAGLVSGTTLTLGSGVVQNGGLNINSTTGTAILTLNGTGNYLFNGYLRNVDTGGTGLLALVKSGSGTQTLAGGNIVYTGPTTVSGGTLELINTTAFASPTINNSATLRLSANSTNAVVLTSILSGNGNLIIDGPGGGTSYQNRVVVRGLGTNRTGGISVVNGGKLWVDRNIPEALGASSIVDIAPSAGFYIYAGTGGSAGNITAVTVGGLTGTGGVYGDTSGGTGTLTIGGGNASATFDGTIGSSNSGVLNIIKIGTGTQTLTGASTYTGTTTINAGTLRADFALGGTSNILSPASVVTLGGGSLEIKGGSGETNTQTINGISGFGTVQLTPNGATSLTATLGAIGAGSINFVGSDATVASLGTATFLTTTTTAGNDGTTRFGANLWNGTTWASTSATGGNHVVQWIGTYSDIYNGTAPGPVAIPTGTPAAEVRILEATSGFANNTLGADETINSLLMSADTTAATVNMGTFTLTVGNGAGANGAIGITATGKSLTLGTAANQGFLTAGNSAAASILYLNNANSASNLTVNSAIKNNAAAGAVSLTSSGNVLLNATNTFTGPMSILAGTVEVGGAGSLGSGTYAGAIANTGLLRYNSTANQTLSGVISGVGGIAKLNTSNLSLSGANTFTGKTSVTGGTLTISSDANLGAVPGLVVADQLSINGATLAITAAGQTLATTRGITLGASGATFDTSTLATSATTSISGVISGTGPVTFKSNGDVSPTGGGAGGLGVYLNNVGNSFTGDVTITSGLVAWSNNAVFGNVANNIILNGGGLLDNTGGTALARNIQVLAGGGTFRLYGSTNSPWSGNITGSGNINRTDGGTLTLSGSLTGFSGTYNNQGGNTTLTGTAATIGGTWNLSTGTLTVNSTANQTLAGVISGAGAFAKNSAGTLALTNVQTYTGATSILGGTLEIAGTGQLGSGTYAAAITNNGTLRYNSTAAQSLTGIISGSGSLIKDGVGSTLTLTQNNTFSGGVTINQGTVMLSSTDDGTSGIKGVVTVNAGGTLDWSAPNPLGYNGGSITSLIINGGTVGGADIRTHYYHNAGSIPITMTGGIIKLGGISTAATDMNQVRSAPITVVASSNTSQILGITSAAAWGIRDGSNQSFTVGDGSQTVDLLVDVIVSQNGAGGSISKDGAGMMQLTKNNGYSGNTTINGGVLDIASGGLYRNINGTDAYNNSAVLQINSGGTLRLKSFAYNAEGGTGGLADYRQRRVLNGGTLEVTDTTHTSGNDFTVNAAGGTFRYNPTVTTDTLTLSGNANSNIQLDGTVGFDTLGNITISEQIEGAGGITKTGNKTLLLSGPNTFTGPITVNSGALVAGVASVANVSGAFGNNAAITLADTAGAGLNITGFNTQIGSLAGGGTTGGNVSLGAATLTTGTNNTSTNFAGGISGTGHLAKAGTGIMTLVNPQLFTGSTTVTAGTIALSGAGSLATSSSLVLATGSSFDIAGISNAAATIRSISGASGSFASLGAKTLELGVDDSNSSFSGDASGTGGSIKKVGTGTLTLSGNNTYSGTTDLTGGTLLLGANNTLPNSAAFSLSGTSVLSTGGFSDTTGALSVLDAPVIDLGSNVAGSTLTFANVTAWTGVLSVWNWTGSGVWSTGTDKLLFSSGTGNITLTNVNFFSDNGLTPIGAGGGLIGNELVPVPEPGALGAALVLLGVIGYRQRRPAQRKV